MPTADARALRGGEDRSPMPEPKGRPDLWSHAIPAFVRGGFPAVVILVLFLVGWWAAAWYLPDPRNLFPGPGEVGRKLLQLAGSEQLLPSLRSTMDRLLRGFLISVVAGGVIALAMARWPVAEKGLKPYLLGLQSIPSIAWTPLAIIWFGFSESSLIFVTVIGSLFSVALSFTDALNSVRPAHVLAARNMGSKGLGLLLRVKIPAAFPAVVSGIKQCWSFAWRSLIGAEIIFASVGLGYLLKSGQDFLDTAQVMAVMVVTLLLGILFEVLLFTRVELWVRKRWGLA
jgi:NitT/TauT family transport system permease protein